MGGNPWRCSQCGAVNEPDSTSCRSCGKWASLFDLETDSAPEPQVAELEPVFEVERQTVPELEVETIALEPFAPEAPAPVPEGEPRPPGSRTGRLLRSLLLPLALVIYLVVSLLSER
jgi:hypothetical protein